VAGFRYTVSDGQGGFSHAQVVLNLAEVNDAPTAQGEAVDSAEDVVLTLAPALLLANDSDVDSPTLGDVLSITSVGQAEHGSVALNDQGEVVFTPEPNYFGLAGFAYTVSDGRGGHTPAWASLTLTPVNDAPTLAGETMDGQEDQALLIDAAALLANDYDVDTATLGDVLSITSVGQAEHGQVSLDEQGRISFTPEANYYGLARQIGQVHIGSAVNDKRWAEAA